MTRIVIPALVALLVSGPTWGADNIEGTAHALDGNTIVFVPAIGAGVEVRLLGIDAPKLKDWPWGPRARGALDEILLKHGVIRCLPTGNEIQKRVIALCYGKGPSGFTQDIGQSLILQGLAVGDRGGGGLIYSADEKAARKNRRGVWKD